MENIVILGSTGSIGCNTLNVIELHPKKYKVIALTANSNIEKLFEQCVKFKPEFAILLNVTQAEYLQNKLKLNQIDTRVLTTSDDLLHVVTLPYVDIIMSAIVGSAGLLPTYTAIKAGKKVLLANKESLIAGGKLIKEALKNSESAKLIPVDSEHSAIFQSLPPDFTYADNSTINKIILTASGGPFRTFSREQLENVKAEHAILHPNWAMGKKVSVDSSTLMNKGLEVIEAYWLFGVPIDKIEVVIHPQSIIHSMVEYIDSSVIAQLGTPDMRTPIAYALAYPERITSGSKTLDFATLGQLTFEKPDYDRFPCLNLAFTALKVGGVAPAVLNAANEVAVEAYLNNQIKFYDISAINQTTLDNFAHQDYDSIEEILAIDQAARNYAKTLIAK